MQKPKWDELFSFIMNLWESSLPTVEDTSEELLEKRAQMDILVQIINKMSDLNARKVLR